MPIFSSLAGRVPGLREKCPRQLLRVAVTKHLITSLTLHFHIAQTYRKHRYITFQLTPPPEHTPRTTETQAKTLTHPQAGTFDFAICLMATGRLSIFLKPAYTRPKPPSPKMWPTLYWRSKGCCVWWL